MGKVFPLPNLKRKDYSFLFFYVKVAKGKVFTLPKMDVFWFSSDSNQFKLIVEFLYIWIKNPSSMFVLKPSGNNRKMFYLKDQYKSEESFKYQLRISNHISKTGFTMDIEDESPWVSGITNNSTLNTGSTIIFNSGYSYYINSFSNLTHIFNNEIQISGVNYEFYSNSAITDTKSCILNGDYLIVFNDENGRIVQVDNSGAVISGISFTDNLVSDINISPISTNRFVLGYYDVVMDKSYLKEGLIEPAGITFYPEVMFYDGKSESLKMNKISVNNFASNNSINLIDLDSSTSFNFSFLMNNNFCSSSLINDSFIDFVNSNNLLLSVE